LPASATTIIQHYGANNPTTEGWSYGTGSTTTAILNDGGYDAWQLADTSTTYGGGYSYTGTEAEKIMAINSGWKLDVTMRIPGNWTGLDQYFGVLLPSINSKYGFWISSEGNDLLVRHWVNGSSGTEVRLSGQGTTYHLFEMVFQPVANTMYLSIDGTKYFQNVAGDPIPTAWNATYPLMVYFGSGSALGTGTARYNEVEFQVLPEPSALLLASLGLLSVIFFMRKR